MYCAILKQGAAVMARRGLRAAALVAILFAHAGCGKESTNEPTTTWQANVIESGVEGAREMTTDPTADNLLQVLTAWKNEEVAKIERGITLKSMWGANHPMSQKYDTVGVNKLLDELGKNAYFKARRQTGKLKKGHLVTGGAVQTQGALYDFLTAS